MISCCLLVLSLLLNIFAVSKFLQCAKIHFTFGVKPVNKISESFDPFDILRFSHSMRGEERGHYFKAALH